MRKLTTIILLCFAVTSIAMSRSVSADNSMSSGSMTSVPKTHQYLLGTWDCAVNVASMEGQGPMTDHGMLTIAMSPGMTMHSHVAAKDYMSDTYQGYDSKSKTHWLNTVDTTGEVTIESSTNGMVFNGTTWQGSTATPTRDTQTKVSDTKIRDVTELKQNGKWTQFAVAVCTKT